MDFKTVVIKLNSKKDEEIIEGLRSIVDECNQLRKDKKNIEEEMCLITQYLQSSPHCVELFNIWNDARGNYDQPILQAVFEVFAECIRYGNDNLQKELCLTILRKQNADVMGAVMSTNTYSNNSACVLLRAICDVGAAGVQLVNQRIPINTINNLPELISNTRTRYRAARWIASMIRNDKEIVGKQILLRQDIISALANGLHHDGEYLMNDLVHLFSESILPTSYCSSKLRQSFFASSTLCDYVAFCEKDTTPSFFKDFVLSLFGNSKCCLYPPLSHLTISSFIPSTIFKVALALNPFKHSFDKDLYLLLIQEHPEILPALFSEPSKQLSAVEAYATSVSVEAKTKVLVNWMLEPRESALWGRTIDFLVEVLKIPVVLPQELISLATSNYSLFLTSIKSWLFPGALNRSTLSKGLSSSHSTIILKTLELIEAIAYRLTRVAEMVYDSIDKASSFLEYFFSYIPLEDSLSQLFKKCCVALLNEQTLVEKITVKSQPDRSAPVVNMISNEMEVEDETDSEEPQQNEHSRLLCQLTATLNSLFSLFAKGLTQFRIDVIPLFSSLNSRPLIASFDTDDQTILLELLINIAKNNPSFIGQIITGKNEIKPLLFLLQLYPSLMKPTQDKLKQLLYILFEESQCFSSLSTSMSTLSILVEMLTPSLCQYLYEVIIDIRSQRIRFLTRNNQCHLQTPLLFHTFLYSALKPKAGNQVVNLFICCQVFFLTQAHTVKDCLALTKKYIEEAMMMKEENLGKDRLLAGPMNDDLLIMLRHLVQEWSGEGESIKKGSLLSLDMNSIDTEYEENVDDSLSTLFHSFLWHTITKDDYEQLLKRTHLHPLLLLSSLQVEGCSVQEAHKLLLESISVNSSSSSVIEPLSTYISLHYHLLCPSIHSSSHLSNQIILFLCHSFMENDYSHSEQLTNLVKVSSLEALESVIVVSCSSFESLFLKEECLDYASTLLSRIASFEKGLSHDVERKVIDLLASAYSTNSVYLLTYCSSALYTEEKLRMIHSILSTPTIQYNRLQPFVFPLDNSLIQQLFQASTTQDYYVKLLTLNLSRSYEEAVKAFFTSSVLGLYLQHIDNEIVQQLISFLLKTYSSIHVDFWKVVLSPSYDNVLHKHFILFTSYLVMSLTHAAIKHTSAEEEIVSIVHDSPFFSDLMACLPNNPDSVVLECFQVLTQYSQFSSERVLDVVSLCKKAFKEEGISKERFDSLLLLCKQDQNEKAMGILILRGLQKLAKKWGGNEIIQNDDINDFIDSLTDLLISEPSLLVLLLKKQNDLLMRFCRLLLRKSLEDWRGVKLLRIILEASYQSNITIPNVSDINLLELVVTHSSYSTILTRIREECLSSNDDELRQKWLSFSPTHYLYSVEFFLFIKVVIQYNPFYCSQSLYFQLLSMYNCSFSPSDRILRDILRSLHLSNRFALEDVGYLFGRFAPASASENIQTPSTWLLEAVSGLRLRKSIEEFPREKQEVMEEEEEEEVKEEEDIVNDVIDEDEERRIELEGMEVEEEDYENHEVMVDNVFDEHMDCIEMLMTKDIQFEVSGNSSILLVDPTVYLPLIHYYLNLSSVDIRAYIAHGVPGYILACMTSSNAIIRQCASCILQRFYEIVLDSSFFEQKQIALVFRKLQNSIAVPSIQLSSIVVSFINESLGILLRPGSPLYTQINRFFVSFPTFNLEDTPLFHQLFLNEKEDYKQLRAWCLRYILRGTQSYQDYLILNRRHVVSQIQSFATSSNTDLYTQKCCLGIVLRLSTIPAVVPSLYRSVGLFPWLSMVLKAAKSRVIVWCVMEVLGNLIRGLSPSMNENGVICSLMIIEQVLGLLHSTKEEEELGDMNRILLNAIEDYHLLCHNSKSIWNSSTQEYFFKVWKMILETMKKYKGKKSSETANLILQDCVLSNDDFFLLCDPQLLSLEVVYTNCCVLLKEIKSSLPFPAKLFADVEKDYDLLFI